MSDKKLFDRFKSTSDLSLEEVVERTEGINGSTVEPVYSARKMRCYSITDSELQQISLANIGITVFFSLGSAMFAFWIDIFKDTMLANRIPHIAEIAIAYVQPVLLFLGVIFWVIGIIVLLWRRNMITLTKEESNNK